MPRRMIPRPLADYAKDPPLTGSFCAEFSNNLIHMYLKYSKINRALYLKNQSLE